MSGIRRELGRLDIHCRRQLSRCCGGTPAAVHRLAGYRVACRLHLHPAFWACQTLPQIQNCIKGRHASDNAMTGEWAERVRRLLASWSASQVMQQTRHDRHYRHDRHDRHGLHDREDLQTNCLSDAPATRPRTGAARTSRRRAGTCAVSQHSWSAQPPRPPRCRRQSAWPAAPACTWWAMCEVTAGGRSCGRSCY